MATATQAQYDAATAALLTLEQQIIQQKNIPSFLLPSQDVLQSYASQAAKVAVDAALGATP